MLADIVNGSAGPAHKPDTDPPRSPRSAHGLSDASRYEHSDVAKRAAWPLRSVIDTLVKYVGTREGSVVFLTESEPEL